MIEIGSIFKVVPNKQVTLCQQINIFESIVCVKVINFHDYITMKIGPIKVVVSRPPPRLADFSMLL